MSLILFTKVSSNGKTGPMPVSTSTKETCDAQCPLKGKGCYAASGPLNIWWTKLTNGVIGITWNKFCEEISNLPTNTLWRMNQSGDLPGRNGFINFSKMKKLILANRNKRVICYTHKRVLNGKEVKRNREIIKYANSNGFTINLSGNNLKNADELVKLNIAPVVSIVPFGTSNTFYTPDGHKGIICPAQRAGYKTDCKTCKLCAIPGRKLIIGFIPHSTAKNKVNKIANE